MLAPPKPPNDELELLIKEARDRQLRRRLLGAAGAAIIAALGLGLYALTHGRTTGPSETLSGRNAPVAVCRSSQLSGTTFLQAATMSGVGPITITNVSGIVCRLPHGVPSVRTTWRGRDLHMQERVLTGWQGRPAHVLRPGAKAAVPLMWTNWCGRPEGMARLVFYARFPNGLNVVAPEQRLTGHPDCVSRADPSILSVGRPIRS
jgi:hypothetical protein